MKTTFERALVALDLSAMDDKILRMAVSMTPLLGIKKLYFLHIIPDFIVPENADLQFQQVYNPGEPLDEQVRKQISRRIQDAFEKIPNLEVQIEVVEGKPFRTLLHWLEVKDVDLLIAGRKNIQEGSGITARRLARQSTCNVLFVPDEDTPDTRRILAPIDFSANAARALHVAIELAQAQKTTPPQTLYVMDLPPSDYYMRHFDTEAFRQVLRQAAQTARVDFMQENGIDKKEVETTFIENIYSNTALHIQEYAEKTETGLIVIGAQGHSALGQLFYGSVTEKLVNSTAPQTILVIR